MIIPLRAKDADVSDFSCRDGEIEFQTGIANSKSDSDSSDSDSISSLSDTTGYGIRYKLTQTGDYPTATIRIPLESGDSDKVALMMSGQISRVDASTSDRITELIVKKAAEEFSQLVIDNRRVGLQMLPYRVFGMIFRPDGSIGYPSPQAVMLPSQYPPHPEIVAYAIADDTLNINLRFPVKTCRMEVEPPSGLKEGYRVCTYVSYPVYIPDKDEVSGSLGSVRSSSGGNVLGVRFSFLTTSRLKYSVAAPEKYYLLTGNENTGYYMSSKAADLPDYSVYAADFGFVPPFPIDSLRPLDSDIDPLDWIADWESSGEGYLPITLPYIYRSVQDSAEVVPDGVDSDFVNDLVESTGYGYILLTRPMAFADAERSRRKAVARGVERLKIHGLADAPCLAVLFGSSDGIHYEPLRQFDPHQTTWLLTPPRLWHRLLLLSTSPFPDLALEI